MPQTGVILPARPVSEAVEQELAKLRSQIPADKRGHLTAGVSTKGVEVGAAWKPTGGLTLSGWAGRLWGGAGWEAGARAIFGW